MRQVCVDNHFLRQIIEGGSTALVGSLQAGSESTMLSPPAISSSATEAATPSSRRREPQHRSSRNHNRAPLSPAGRPLLYPR